MGNTTSKSAKRTWADSTAAMKLWVAALFSVVAAVALMLTTASAASAYTLPPPPVITSPAEGSYDSDGNFVITG